MDACSASRNVDVIQLRGCCWRRSFVVVVGADVLVRAPRSGSLVGGVNMRVKRVFMAAVFCCYISISRLVQQRSVVNFCPPLSASSRGHFKTRGF